VIVPPKILKPTPPEYCPKTALIEARALLPLLSSATSTETPDSIRRLIAMSPTDERDLAEKFGADARRFKTYRERISTEFNVLVDRRQRT
jgi:hypothetical protein